MTPFCKSLFAASMAAAASAACAVTVWPDYFGITVPPNIAPLDFEVRDLLPGARVEAAMTGRDGSRLVASGAEIVWNERGWKKFLGAKQDAATAQVGKVTAAPPSKENSGANGAAIASSVAALGVGVGMLGAACAGMISVVAGLPAWKVAAGLVAVVLLVSLPSVILTWFKLRTRDIGAVLNAGGWAVNRPLYFSMALARTFTRLPPCRCAWGWLLLLALLAIGVTAAFFFLRCGCCAGTCA